MAIDRRHLILSGLAATAGAGPALAASRKDQGFAAAWASVTGRFHADLDQDGIVGGALWFVRDGQVLARESHGFADRDSGRRVDDGTIFHWASQTKTFTAISLMQLRDRGMVALDDPVLTYMPELARIHDPFGGMKEVTLRHLLSHSSGLRGATFPWGGDKPWHPYEPKDWSQVDAMMPYTEIAFPPGSRYAYSNLGLSIVGRVVEIVSGQHIDGYVDKNILKPLKMHDSFFDRTPYHLIPRRSNNYYLEGGKAVANGIEVDTGATLGNGGLNTSIPDFVAYMNFLDGVGDTGVYDTVLSRRSLQEMWTPRIITDDVEGPAFAEQVGVGFHMIDWRKGARTTRFIGHTGSQMGYRSFFYVEPVTRTAVIWAVNSSPRDDDPKLVHRQRANLFETLFPVFGG